MILMVIAELADDDEKAFMLSLYKDYYGLVRKTLYVLNVFVNKQDGMVVNKEFVD